jgi:cellulase/cellobiase CelA1
MEGNMKYLESIKLTGLLAAVLALAGSPAVAQDDGLVCEHSITAEWSQGFIGAIRVTNNGSSTVDGWRVCWECSGITAVHSLWNADFAGGTDEYCAVAFPWNSTLSPGRAAEFGYQADKESGILCREVTFTVCEADG